MRLTDSPPLPKYWQLAEYFRQQLAQGVLKPGDRLPSLAEMQTEHNASRPTVERAHALLEKEGLIVRRHGAGVFVCEPRKKSTHGAIGLSGGGFSFNNYTSYWAQIMGGVRDAASSAQMQLVILDDNSTEGWERTDGVLVCDWSDRRKTVADTLSLPVVSLLTPIKNVTSVVADDYNGGLMAAQHLVELGHRRIGFLHALSEQPILKQRLQGYRDALTAAGIKPQKKWRREISGYFTSGNQIVSAAREEMQRWIEADWRETGCTALMCQNDETALGAIQALQCNGLEVPNDVSVVGFDGTEFCELTTPRLSSVEVPLREIGATAVTLLLAQIHDNAPAGQHRVLPTLLQPRDSSAPV